MLRTRPRGIQVAQLEPPEFVSRHARARETALHPNSGTTCSTIPERGRGRPEGFAGETAAVSGQSKQDINRHLARAEGHAGDHCIRPVHRA